ncbi:hypothetical protein LAV_00186 [Sphingobium phage Lacusarx]|uniref:Uncharacterized protein n=1 Tax=Sphingobium phage Lacusarx TaxID=1980139 RepID=A0A1W6DXE0_9CAUD|nr:hypothetical protein FDH44_gp117 [Sphingobium phage Lacusarx]ARK07561.1 hypothetical protein LAV_00186 [Sphingobium phage Lacusarx]
MTDASITAPIHVATFRDAISQICDLGSCAYAKFPKWKLFERAFDIAYAATRLMDIEDSVPGAARHHPHIAIINKEIASDPGDWGSDFINGLKRARDRIAGTLAAPLPHEETIAAEAEPEKAALVEEIAKWLEKQRQSVPAHGWEMADALRHDFARGHVGR